MFLNRVDAGRQLAAALTGYQNSSPIVLSISDGGAAVGFEVAKWLSGQFSLLMVQKLPYPDNHRFEFGAIAEDDSIYLLPAAASTLPLDKMKAIINTQKQEIKRRIKVLRGGQPLPNINQKVVILVSDGITLGAVTYAAIYLCRKNNPHEIVIAAPVSSPEVGRSLQELNDVHETIILRQPRFLRKVSQVYQEWNDFAEHEVLAIMQKWHRDYA